MILRMLGIFDQTEKDTYNCLGARSEQYIPDTSFTIVKLKVVNSSSPGQNGRHFADDIFKRIFLNDNIRTSIQTWLKIVPNDN